MPRVATNREMALADDTLLSDDLLRQLMAVGEVDLLVGISSYNNANTIVQCIETIETTFHQHFLRERAVIVDIDRGSKDGTPELVMNAASGQDRGGRGITYLRTMHRVASQYDGGPSIGRAIQANKHPAFLRQLLLLISRQNNLR